MNIPIPAETPDPNIDQPTLPPSEPEPIPEQEPPESTPPPKGDPPTTCLLYTSPSPRDLSTSRMPSSA